MRHGKVFNYDSVFSFIMVIKSVCEKKQGHNLDRNNEC